MKSQIVIIDRWQSEIKLITARPWEVLEAKIYEYRPNYMSVMLAKISSTRNQLSVMSTSSGDKSKKFLEKRYTRCKPEGFPGTQTLGRLQCKEDHDCFFW